MATEILVYEKTAYTLFDTLLELWRAKAFPYNRPDAVIPQTLVPEHIRKDKYALARFYFYVCIYMRGGIESTQVFRAFFRLWEDHPYLFDPVIARFLPPQQVQQILKQYIGWDSRAASINWVENSLRLVNHWKCDPLELLRELRHWDEALRRMRNKLTKRDQKKARANGLGFRGWQPKMVSMFLYFMDWEGLLETRFLYPTPADFHNFRLGFNQGVLVLTSDEAFVRATEAISLPWRTVVLKYLRERKADPVELADALWLFSLVLCGNSPLTVNWDQDQEHRKWEERADKTHFMMLASHHAPVAKKPTDLINARRTGLEKTCLVCPLRRTCTLAIPSKPYYTMGKLVLSIPLGLPGDYPVFTPKTRVQAEEPPPHPRLPGIPRPT